MRGDCQSKKWQSSRMSSPLFHVPDGARRSWAFASFCVHFGMGHVGLFTRHFVLILLGRKEEERRHQRELKVREPQFATGKILWDLCQCLPFLLQPSCLKRDHTENKSSLYKWMGRSEPFELDLICLVSFKRRDPPELVRGLSEVHWHSTRC